MENLCPICFCKAKHFNRNIVTIDNTTGSIYTIDCPKCGEFRIKDRAKIFLESKDNISERIRANISSWISRNQEIYIDENACKKLTLLKCPDFKERIFSFFLELVNNTSFIGQYVNVNFTSLQLLTKTWSINITELFAIKNYLEENNYIEINKDIHTQNTYNIKITNKGWFFYEENMKNNTSSDQGFVAMWFDPSMTSAYQEAIVPAITLSGYRPFRIDLHNHNNDITDEIIANIRRSKFLIADYTDHRGGVYYEAGFARGLGIEVIMTCREDELSKLHFDVNHINCIKWNQSKLEDFKIKLTKRIEAILGRGPHAIDA